MAIATHCPTITKSRKHGFTLIELSIVLVVIGLIVGGILVGQDLIQGAKLRYVVSENQEFALRYNTFKLKYNCIPGDCPNATQFFGQAPSCPSVTATGTCNGDGNGHILWQNPSFFEHRWLWNHMYHAGLTEGYVSPYGGSFFNNQYVTPPISKGSNYEMEAFWFIGSTSDGFAQMIPSSGLCRNSGTNMRGIGLQTIIRNIPPNSRPASPVETVFNTMAIDTKIDDGMPCGGRFHGTGGELYTTTTFTNCITGMGEMATYDLTQTGDTCRYILQLE